MLNLCKSSLSANILRRFSTVSAELPAKLTLVKEANGIRNIILNSPKNRNALSLDMMSELLTNLRRNKQNEDLRCIVLSATGSVFSAGHNLKEFSMDKGQQLHRQVFEKATELMLEIIQSPVPVIAKVNGLSAAAGCQLVATCDLVICTKNSSFSTPGANFGIFCSTPGIAVSRTVSQKQALYMLLTGNAITADDALKCGLITRVVDNESELDEEVNRICESIKSKSRAIVWRGKEFFYQQNQMTLKSAYKYGEQEMVENIATADGQEGVRSFIEKRKPIWNHSKDE